MDPKEIVIRTLTFDNPARIPRQCWLLPWAEKKFPLDAARLAAIYPDDIVPVAGMYTVKQYITGNRYEEGIYIDEWGCIFNNIHPGLIGVPFELVIKTWDDLDNFSTPESMLAVDIQQVNAFCREKRKFTYSNSWIRPFERYQFIRTTELTMMDIGMDSPGMKLLIAKIHDHYLKEVETWAQTEIDAIGIMDDWGMQNGMMVSPEYFRKYFKSLYRDYAEIAKHYGKYVFMHSDGNIAEIIPDLIEIGIDALNSQLFCMNIGEIGKLYHGKITFWGEIDRQHILPEGTAKEIEAAVEYVYNSLYSSGGVIGQVEFGPAARPENIFHVFECWNKIHKQ